MTKERYFKILHSALLADAHAMCLHWNYNQDDIKKLIRSDIDLKQLNSGEHSKYYKGKSAGEQSHHGDQILHLFHFLKEHTSFSLREYQLAWKKYIDGYQWYIDSSTKGTLEHMTFNIEPTGADSTDFCGVAMPLPLIAYELKNPAETLPRAIIRVSMTHSNTLTKDTTEWFIRSLLLIVEGDSIMRAMDKSAEHVNNSIFQKIYQRGKEIIPSTKSIPELMSEVGLGCGIEVGLPILMVLMHRHHDNYMDFLIENTGAGADITSRALVGGALLGASEHVEMPEQLLAQLKNKLI